MGTVSVSCQQFRVTRKLQETKKPAHLGKKLPERLTLNSLFRFPLRRTSCVPPVWPHITLEASFNDGGGSQAHKYHMGKDCQRDPISPHDATDRRRFNTTFDGLVVRRIQPNYLEVNGSPLRCGPKPRWCRPAILPKARTAAR